MIRLVLQSCLWAGKKINMTSSLTTNSNLLNLSNPILQKLQVYNNPSTIYDVVNKSYLTSFTSKYFKTVTNLDFYIYVDITKPRIFSLNGGTINRSLTLNTYYNNDSFSFRVLYFDVNNIILGVELSNNGTAWTSSTHASVSISLVGGLLKIYQNASQNINIYEM